MRALLVLVLVVLAAPGPGRPEPAAAGPESATRGVDTDAESDADNHNATLAKGLDSGSPFWDRLYVDCGKRTSLRCVQKSAFRFLKHALGEKDVVVTDSLVFRRNHNGLSSPHPLAEVPALLKRPGGGGLLHDAQDKVDDAPDEEAMLLQANALPTVEDLTDDLYDQGMSFLKSHDVHLRLPSMLGGAEVRLSPRAFEDDGAVFKISFSRPHVDPSDADRGPRMFLPGMKGGGIIKKITQKLFKKKLMTSFFALLLIIKMIKVKLMFLLPLILGVGTAKKLLLKVLLFLFPALSHLFKLCSYYHANYAKYHHHHHKIAHHHHVIPVPVPQPVPVAAGPPPSLHHHGPESYAGAPPPYSAGPGGPPSSSYGPPPSGPIYGAPPSGPGGPGGHGGYDESNPFDVVGGSGPGGGGGYEYPAHNRNENLGVLPGNQQSGDVLASWGLGAAPGVNPGAWEDQRVYRHTPSSQGGAGGVKKKQTAGAAGGAAGAAGPAGAASPSLNEVVGPTVEVAYDPFYSPLLQRMDNVFVQLGFNEEACRERLVCSMYKSPARFAPHSNLVSAELSRDPSELQKPSSLNSAVVRFYRYVQAARDGQNAKDCLQLYPACTVNTEL